MIGDSLTTQNLTAILEAMEKIQDCDRSQYFDAYFNEVKNRIAELQRAKAYMKADTDTEKGTAD